MRNNAPTRVALCHGGDRTVNLRRAVALVIDEIDWSNRRAVLIKPNLVAAGFPYAITHPDALAAMLDAVRQRYDGPLTIAEGCAVDPTMDVFAAQGYGELAAFYRVRLVDLNADETVLVTVFDRKGGPLCLRLARTVVTSDCRISLSLPKTHDTVLVTLSIKNMIMGALVNRRLAGCAGRPAWLDRLGKMLRGHGNGWGSDKRAMHQGYPTINVNLALLAPLVRPHLSVLDGCIAMEGAGPVFGEPVPWGIAVAGTDPLAVDLFTARLMGFSREEVGYLHYCAELGLGCTDPEQIKVLGGIDPETVARRFRPHPRHAEQRRWHRAGALDLLRGKSPTALAASLKATAQ